MLCDSIISHTCERGFRNCNKAIRVYINGETHSIYLKGEILIKTICKILNIKYCAMKSSFASRICLSAKVDLSAFLATLLNLCGAMQGKGCNERANRDGVRTTEDPRRAGVAKCILQLTNLINSRFCGAQNNKK